MLLLLDYRSGCPEEALKTDSPLEDKSWLPFEEDAGQESPRGEDDNQVGVLPLLIDIKPEHVKVEPTIMPQDDEDLDVPQNMIKQGMYFCLHNFSPGFEICCYDAQR